MDERRQIFTLQARGERLEVITWADGDINHAQLSVEGTVVAEATGGALDDTDLAKDTRHHTQVSWGFRDGRVRRCGLVEPGKGEVKKRSVPFAPPPGTRAARIHAWGERHPNLYALRHPLANLAGTAFVLLGVGAFIRLIVEPLLPDVKGPDLPDLPSVDLPDWLHYLNPFWYLAELINWLGRLLAPLFSWIPPLVDWIPDGAMKIIVGFLIAVAVAVREVRRRKRVARAGPTEPALPPATPVERNPAQPDAARDGDAASPDGSSALREPAPYDQDAASR